jgi:hypothetical protein
MRELGAYDAVAMDGGTSTGLYFGGRMIAQPGRALTNALVVYGYQARYESARSTFLGGPIAPFEAQRSPQSPSLMLQIEPAPDGVSTQPEDNPPRPLPDLPVEAPPDPLTTIAPTLSAEPLFSPSAPPDAGAAAVPSASETK